MDETIKQHMRKTKSVLSRLQSYRGQSVYGTLIELLEETRQDIRFLNDTEQDMNQVLRNQGGIWWLGELVREMKKDPNNVRQPTDTDIDGAYTEI